MGLALSFLLLFAEKQSRTFSDVTVDMPIELKVGYELTTLPADTLQHLMSNTIYLVLDIILLPKISNSKLFLHKFLPHKNHRITWTSTNPRLLLLLQEKRAVGSSKRCYLNILSDVE